MDKQKFAKGVERLVNPMDVGSMHFIQGFNKLMPKPIQNFFVESSAKKIPYMGFVVEPYSFFLCYEIVDIEWAKKLLPSNFELIKTKIFDDDEPKYYCIFGCFRAHTSAFWGSRAEFYIIAENIETGLLSWIIVDYDSNTISYDKKNGLRSPESSGAVITINHNGTVYVDVERNDKKRKLIFNSNIKSALFKKLDQRLWLEGNLSIGYSKDLAVKGDGIFSLKFDPDEFAEALNIPLEKLNIDFNTWYPGLFKEMPSKVVCFPYAQHFISDSPGSATTIQNREELIKVTDAIDVEHLKVFSAQPFKTMFLVGGLISFLITLTLVFLLIFVK